MKDLARALTKLGTAVQAACTVTASLDGRAEAHTAKGTLTPAQLMGFIEQVRTDASTMCTTHHLSESHTLRSIMEAITMLDTLLKGARNSGQHSVSWRRGCGA